MKLPRFVFKLLGLTFFSSVVFAQNSINTKIHNFYQSPRAMGMGNAYSSIADDFAAMMYNPSQLAFRKDGEIQWNIIKAGVSSNAKSMVDDIKTASDTVGTDEDKANAVAAALEKYYGAPVGTRLSPTEFFWVRPNWGVSLVLADITLDTTIQRQVGPLLDVNLIKDSSLNFAYSQMVTGDLSVGGLFRINHRNYYSGSYTTIDLAIDPQIMDFKKTKEGVNVDFDIAATWKPDFFGTSEAARHVASEAAAPAAVVEPKKEEVVDGATTKVDPKPEEKVEVKTDEKAEIKKEEKVAQAEEPKKELSETGDLTFTAVLRNVLSMNYSKENSVNKDATEAPDKNERVLDLGAAYDLIHNDLSTLKLSLEFKNIMHPNASVRKSSHVGIEYTPMSSYWFKPQIRVGLNQLYFTAGLSLNLGPLYLDFVTYGEEIGTDKARIENRVNAVSLALKF